MELDRRSGQNPSMNRYRITEVDKVYAVEFKRNLDSANHYHSPGLQRVLNVMRGGPKAGKYVLIVEEPFRSWRLGKLPARRGEPVRIVPGYRFRDLRDAEWTVFNLRWREHTGEALSLEAPALDKPTDLVAGS